LKGILTWQRKVKRRRLPKREQRKSSLTRALNTKWIMFGLNQKNSMCSRRFGIGLKLNFNQ
jgi:hypothetical protein